MNQEFKFKQFNVHQDRCAMKVGTDGVLLGAWASIDHLPANALDIGAGTGVLALMIAQRSAQTFIEAIEIDENAYEQCSENFERSPWADRLFCYHAALLEFVEELTEDGITEEDLYDLIICNPPFYSEQFKSPDSNRNTARFQDAMPFQHLLYAVSNLLSTRGKFAVVIPYSEQEQFLELCAQSPLHLNRRCSIKGHPEAEVKRVLLEFSFQEQSIQEEGITIEIERHQYTEAYKALTSDFYLKM